jgi:polyphosphate kinase
VSENIRVHSVIDRFLEHARVSYWEAGGAREVYAASADWMPRNFQRRVEILFPIEDEALKTRIVTSILGVELEDDVKGWTMEADGHYVRVPPRDSEGGRRSQKRFLELARDAAARADQKALRDRPFVVKPVRHRPTKAEEPVTVAPAAPPADPTVGRTSTVPGGGE